MLNFLLRSQKLFSDDVLKNSVELIKELNDFCPVVLDPCKYLIHYSNLLLKLTVGFPLKSLLLYNTI